jgi:hypothetical protein
MRDPKALTGSPSRSGRRSASRYPLGKNGILSGPKTAPEGAEKTVLIWVSFSM